MSRVAVLLRADETLNDGIDRLEMSTVRRNLDPDVASRLRAPHRPGALVILHVALVGREVRMDDALEAREDALGRVADDVGEDVEPSAVRHADDDFVEPARRRAFHQPVEERNRRVDALDRVPPLAQELRPEEPLELSAAMSRERSFWRTSAGRAFRAAPPRFFRGSSTSRSGSRCAGTRSRSCRSRRAA